MKKSALLLLGTLLFQIQHAQNITWSEHIAPILYHNCTKCHHDGGLAPFSLLNYSDAYSNRFTMATAVTERIMPPWPPDPHYQRYAYERILSQTDINMISAWVDGGGASGDTSTAPSPPVYTNGSALGTPDLSVTIPTYTIPSNQSADIYQCFVIPSGLLQDKYITAMEIVPGNPAIVHHVLIYQDTTAERICAQLDSAEPGPGYLNFGGVGSDDAIAVGGWAPGALPYSLPTGMGIKLYEGADIVIQIHYPNGSNNQSDSTTINLKLANSVTREIFLVPALYHYYPECLQGGPLHIPADSIKTFEERTVLPDWNIDFSILSIAPHCHLLGKKWLSYAITPQNDTIPLIKIDNWDFHWQGFYAFKNIVRVPRNSTLYGFCTYDNTAANTENPNIPPQDVSLGENTTDEMMIIYFAFTVYLGGDENIVIDSSQLVDINDPGIIDTTTTTNIPGPQPGTIVSTLQLYEAVPNPGKDEVTFSYFLPTAEPVRLKIFDINGRLVDEISSSNNIGFNNVKYNCTSLSPGTYIYSLGNQSVTRSKQLIIVK